MSNQDLIALLVTYAYAFGLLAIATLIQKFAKLPTDFTRKVVHIGAGMWIFGLYGLFETWYWGVFPMVTFIFFNYISYRFALIKAVDSRDSSPGTVYFVISTSILLTCFWPRGQFWIAAVGLMAMTWGDAFAAILGRKYGKHSYKVWSNPARTFEGSLAMFGFSLVAIGLTLMWQSQLTIFTIIALAICLAALATLLEAISPNGLDNLVVPIGVSLSLFALLSWSADLSRLLGGFVLSILIGIIAYRRRSLSFSGVIGAILTGTFIFGFGGWVWGLTLIAFFVYGSLLSKFKEHQKNTVAAEKFDKGSRRDSGQALANGGLAAVLAVLFFVYPQQGWLFAAFIGIMATVNADTWATELGVLSKSPPRSVLTGKIVTPGTSGGISALGTFATLLGGFVIGLTVFGLIAIFDFNAPVINYWWTLPVGLIAGLFGSVSDSILGATLQTMYTKVETGQETEKKFDPSGTPNVLRRGWPLMDNDAVNFISSICGASLAVLLYNVLT